MFQHTVADREIKTCIGFGDFAAATDVQRRINVSALRLFDLPRIGINSGQLALANAVQKDGGQLPVAAAKIEAAALRNFETCQCRHLDRPPQCRRGLKGVFGNKLYEKTFFHGALLADECFAKGTPDGTQDRPMCAYIVAQKRSEERRVGKECRS